jgi:DNA topoisomerase VI subunit B
MARETFSTSRLIEFVSRKELTAQTGHGPEDWPLVVLKELTDNALDACEEAGIAPVIRVTVAGGKIRVRDNGPGIPTETVASILDFTTRTSSREAYVAPDRGAQGNALKTILAMPFALSGDEGRVEIVAKGVRHTVVFRTDQIRQVPVLDLATEAAPVRIGTSITVHWPAKSRLGLAASRSEFLQIVEAIGFLNPHAALAVAWHADDRNDADVRLTWPATRPAWQKWTPAAPTCPHWYGLDDLVRLLGAYIAHDRDRGRMQTVSEFVARFNGLTGTAKRKAVVDAVGLSRAPLDSLVKGSEFDRELVQQLLHAMKSASKPVKPERLGTIGREHVAARFEAMGGDPETFQYKLSKGEDNGRPWALEVAFAYRPEKDGRRIITGVNWSPGIREPFPGLEGMLEASYCGDEDEPVIFFAHLATPRPAYVDRGKSKLVF